MLERSVIIVAALSLLAARPAWPATGSDVANRTGGAMVRVLGGLTSPIGLAVQAVYNGFLAPGADVECAGGGRASRTCTTQGLETSLDYGFDHCGIATPAGSLELNGSLSIKGRGFCPDAVIPPLAVRIDVEGKVRGEGDADLLTAKVDVTTTGSAARVGGACFILELGFTGTNGTFVADRAGGAHSSLTLEDVAIHYESGDFTPLCVPLGFVFGLTGHSTIEDSLASAPLPLDFADFSLVFDNSGADVVVSPSGGLTSECTGGAVSIEAGDAVATSPGDLCPRAGSFLVSGAGGAGRVRFGGGGVEIDGGDDGVVDATYPSCQAMQLLSCSDAPSLAGDANCDAALTAVDLVALQDFIGRGARSSCGRDDATGDAKLDGADVAALIPRLFD